MDCKNKQKYKILNEIKEELNLKKIFIKHEISEKDRDIDILISKSRFNEIIFPANYKLINFHFYNNHYIYIRFDIVYQSFIKIDFIINELNYCDVVKIPIKKLKCSQTKIVDDIYTLKDEYLYLDKYLGYMFFQWKKERASLYLQKKILPVSFLLDQFKAFNLKQKDFSNTKEIKFQLIKKRLPYFLIYQIKKKFFNIIHLKNKLTIAMIGIDGAGKTTIIKQLEEELSKIFNVKTTYMGRRDFCLWPIRIYRYFKYSKYINQMIKKNNSKSFVKEIGFWENLGIFTELYYRHLKSILNMNAEIILFDRYFYDAVIHSKSCFMESLLVALIPKTHLLILLDAPDDVLYERKKEVELNEIKALKKIIYSKDYIKAIMIDTHKNNIQNCVKLINKYIYQNLSK